MGEVGDGFKIAMCALDSGRYSVAAGCVGICQGSLDASISYSKERTQFDRPIASFQLVQEMIADMVVRDRGGARPGLARRLAQGQGKPSTTETSIAKLYATEAAVNCADRAIQVHGGSGYVDDYPVERYLRDARVTTLYEGTSQIQKLIIGARPTPASTRSSREPRPRRDARGGRPRPAQPPRRPQRAVAGADGGAGGLVRALGRGSRMSAAS